MLRNKRFRGKQIFVLLVCFICLTSCSKAIKQQIMEQLELGQKYLAELDYEQAVVAFRKVIKLDPKEFSAYEGLVSAYSDSGNMMEIFALVDSGMDVFEKLSAPFKTENLVAAYEKFMRHAADVANAHIADKEYDDLYSEHSAWLTEWGGSSDTTAAQEQESEKETRDESSDSHETQEQPETKDFEPYWFENLNGWRYYTEPGIYVVDEMKEIDGSIYYFGTDGYMAVGRQKIDGKWYCFHENGTMAQNEWVDNRYYGNDGVMLTNAVTPDGYEVDEEGLWVPSVDYTPYLALLNNSEVTSFALYDFDEDGTMELIVTKEGRRWLDARFVYALTAGSVREALNDEVFDIAVCPGIHSLATKTAFGEMHESGLYNAERGFEQTMDVMCGEFDDPAPNWGDKDTYRQIVLNGYLLNYVENNQMNRDTYVMEGTSTGLGEKPDSSSFDFYKSWLYNDLEPY